MTAISAELHSMALPPGATVEVGGGPLLNLQTRQAVREDLQRAEYASLPMTPSTMTLLGGWNWWAPDWLSRIRKNFALDDHGLTDTNRDQLTSVSP